MDDKKYSDKTLEHKFHHLWTKALNTKDYDKQEWIEFENELKKLIEKIKLHKK